MAESEFLQPAASGMDSPRTGIRCEIQSLASVMRDNSSLHLLICEMAIVVFSFLESHMENELVRGIVV